MEFYLKHRFKFAAPPVFLLSMVALTGAMHGQAPSVGVSGAAGSKLREAMSQANPAAKLRLLREAEPLFTDPVSKYSALYPNLIDAYIQTDDLNDAANAIDQMVKEGGHGITETDARLNLARALVGEKQYDAALQQLNPTVAFLQSADARTASKSRVQQSLVAALAMQGEALLEMGSAQKALEALRGSQDLQRNGHLDPSANTARNIARCDATLGKPDEALDNFAEAYSLAAHRVNAIQRHLDVAGLAASSGFTQELSEQQGTLALIKQEVVSVYGSRAAQLPLGKFLDQKLEAFDKAQIADAMSKAKVSKPAPDFNLSSIDGNKTKLSGLKGKVVLLNFWDTSCKPCRAEYPHLQKIQDEFNNKGLSVLMINLDDDTTGVKPFAEKYGFTARVLLKDDNIQRAYGIGPIPHTVIIDGAGVIRFNEVGFTLDTPNVFRAEITSLLPKAQ
jgi:thiol-disulfide isomerase/thioredoxin/predicted negative regulator of RcsB-dependent stress response